MIEKIFLSGKNSKVDKGHTPGKDIWEDPRSVGDAYAQLTITERSAVDHLANVIAKVRTEKELLKKPNTDLTDQKEAASLSKNLKYFLQTQAELEAAKADIGKEMLDPEIAEFGKAVLDKLSPLFREMAQQGRPIEGIYAEILNLLVYSKDQEISGRAGSYLLDNIDCFLKTKPGEYSVYVTLDGLMHRKDLITKNNLVDLLWELTKKNSMRFSQVATIVGMLLVSNQGSRDLAKTFIKSFLEKNELPYGKVLQAWVANSRTGASKDKKETRNLKEAMDELIIIVGRNLVSINSLEREQEGVCKFLYDNYGISNFARFNETIWLDQYQERNRGGPYGLVIASRDDWNSSSYSEDTRKAYDGLHANILPSHSLRIVEAKSLPELAKLLNRTIKKAGEPPKFVVWSGHSMGSDFLLGRNLYRRRNYKFTLDVGDFDGEAMQRMRPYLDLFSKDTIMIVDACTPAGDKERLPVRAAKETGNKFIYPEGDTSIEDFGVSHGKEGKLVFDVKYGFGAKTLTANNESGE